MPVFNLRYRSLFCGSRGFGLPTERSGVRDSGWSHCLCPWARHFICIASVYPAVSMGTSKSLGGNLRWNSIPSRGVGLSLSSASGYRLGISSSPMSPSGSERIYFFLYKFIKSIYTIENSLLLFFSQLTKLSCYFFCVSLFNKWLNFGINLLYCTL